MSTFGENFQRSQSENLSYDDIAFYYWLSSMLIVVLVPTTYSLIIQPALYGELVPQINIKNCKCIICEERMNKRMAQHRYKFLNLSFAIKAVVLATLWAMCISSYIQVKDEETLGVFIPHEILGVASGATPAEVKRAYRKLSRAKHPDKNPDNPLAVNEFIQITKAYTILTDPIAAENWAKYGNPDGQRASFHVSIALPRKIQEKESQILVLVIFFLIVVVLIPYLFFYYLSQEKIEAGGILKANRTHYLHLLDETMDAKTMPGLLA